MTTRRNLERNGNSEITASPSWSHHSGQKNTQHKPSKIHPDQAAKTATKTTSYGTVHLLIQLLYLNAIC
ncbi:hypothetical protein YC2023_101486 [Brassica napus]